MKGARASLFFFTKVSVSIARHLHECRLAAGGMNESYSAGNIQLEKQVPVLSSLPLFSQTLSQVVVVVVVKEHELVVCSLHQAFLNPSVSSFKLDKTREKLNI